MALTKNDTLTEDELFCDAEEQAATHLQSLDLDDEYYDDQNEEEYSDYEDVSDDAVYVPSRKQNSKQISDDTVKNTSYQNNSNLFQKYLNKINVEKYDVSCLPQHTTNLLREKERSLENERIRVKDKRDRATAEQVMDPRTRMILFKLLRKNIISEINGCISTGKEANVYQASGNDGQEYAIKVYKTSILVFKDRDKYVSGEFRFRHGYCRHNPRKMVQTWAEKEMRNLVRMHSNGLNVPEPIILRLHVLVMKFIGKNGWPAPKLKDVELSQSKARELYRDVVGIMWKMYNKCKLVHADLSEFNMLYHNGQVYIIDVSQSVEHDHPHALEFLRKDCTNITEYFKKKEVATMGIKQLFDFITDPSITEDNMEQCLDRLAEQAAERGDVTATEQVEEEVFKQAYIPKRLTEVFNYERDINKAKSGLADDLIYKTLVGLKSDLSGTVQQPEILENRASDEEESSDEETSSEEEGQSKFKDDSRPKDETLEEKRARKKAVKEAKAKKRKNKIKKHFESAYKPRVLRNWEVPKLNLNRPRKRSGKTKFIVNDRGHLLPCIGKTDADPWGGYISTWRMPKKIDRDTANELSGLVKLDRRRQKASAESTDNKQQDGEQKEMLEKDTNKENIDDTNIKPVPYVPGDLTDDKHRPASHYELAANRFPKKNIELPKGFPNTRDDFSKPIPEPEKDTSKQVEEFYALHKDMVNAEYKPTDNRNGGSAKESNKGRLSTPILAAISNFNLAKRLHKENLEHNPLPDTITDAAYRKLQMQRRQKEAGSALQTKPYATAVGWKEYSGYPGPTRCTKLKVFRPKTCGHRDIRDDESISSFDKKWRFIRQNKVSPIDLAICWDLCPEDPKDEPKPPTHIDGSNGSVAPAVFSLVQSPKDEEDTEAKKCDGVHGCSQIFEHGSKPDDPKDFFFDRTKVPKDRDNTKSDFKSSKRAKSACNLNEIDKQSMHSKGSSNSSNARAKSAYNLHEAEKRSTSSKGSDNNLLRNNFHQSSPNVNEKEAEKHSTSSKDSNNNAVRNDMHQSFPNLHQLNKCSNKNCLKNKSTQDRIRPRSDYKMAFKAGVPQKTVSRTYPRIQVPRQKDPYRGRNYVIDSLAPPFSLQKVKRQDYPDHWRLATVYQHSYKPIQARKRPMLQTVFK
ncbi:hypothetical protein NQ315_002190 [Exocentrus adspersus]|uniref:Serine/threonine-protein kinase RIO1 n=1 Tax=Exocentrus adspersus TaxID=1586481 RepID=A0AAV8VZ48_9CUCU|nr:hypothetical protein NQ315_002190 [Exocentrus adspersus]